DRPLASRRLRTYAFHAFVLVGTLPVLVLAAVDGQLTAAKREADGGARLHEAVTALNQQVNQYVAGHGDAVQSLATALGERKLEPADRQRLVDDYRRIYPGFITLFVADRGGIVRQIAPMREAPPINDREY